MKINMVESARSVLSGVHKLHFATLVPHHSEGVEPLTAESEILDKCISHLSSQ
jgi:hypothetical protein